MTIRVICAMLLILCCGYIGFVRAAEYNTAPEQIRCFIYILTCLKTEITVRNSVLDEAIENAAGGRTGTVAEIFRNTGRLIADGSTDVQEAWSRAYKASQNRLAADVYVSAIMAEFAAELGGGSRKTQEGNIAAALERLKTAECEAEEKRRRSAGLCRSLGFAAGILLAVLLI